MRERPILFSDPMVRALLAGAKTQTRRIVKPLKYRPLPDTNASWRYDGVWSEEDGGDGCRYMERLDDKGNPIEEYHRIGRCPYGDVGDRLWVREAWYPLVDEIGQVYPIYRASWPWRATSPKKWKSPIHMPRSACRLSLEITDVRVERLQAITAADALAEGAGTQMRGCTRYDGEARDVFRWIWSTIHGEASWEANPWVWRIAFRRIAPISNSLTERGTQ